MCSRKALRNNRHVLKSFYDIVLTAIQIQEETGASVSTKGVWYPDRTKATERDPPLYLHISAPSQESLSIAIERINELINIDLGPLVEDKKDRLREKVGNFFHASGFYV